VLSAADLAGVRCCPTAENCSSAGRAGKHVFVAQELLMSASIE
jgi:hypothetical protein